MEMVVKGVDGQGRVVIPKAWREKHLKGRKVVMRLKDGGIEITPYPDTDLTKYFDSVEVQLKSDLGEWHSVRRELRRP